MERECKIIKVVRRSAKISDGSSRWMIGGMVMGESARVFGRGIPTFDVYEGLQCQN